MRLIVNPALPYGKWVDKAVGILAEGGTLLCPTDTGYGIVCMADNCTAINNVRSIKELEPQRYLTLIFPDLKDISEYAQISDPSYRIMKRVLPGPYTFILKATKKVPKIFNSNQKTVGVRVPDYYICNTLVSTLERPLVNTSFPQNKDELWTDPVVIEKGMNEKINLIIDVGILSINPSTIIDLSIHPPELVRQGQADASWIL